MDRILRSSPRPGQSHKRGSVIARVTPKCVEGAGPGAAFQFMAAEQSKQEQVAPQDRLVRGGLSGERRAAKAGFRDPPYLGSRKGT